jgi:general secretion pathway protein D
VIFHRHSASALLAGSALLLALIAIPAIASTPAATDDGAFPAGTLRLPLEGFVRRVFGEALGETVVIAPALADEAAEVELRLATPVGREQLERIARHVLALHGVAAKRRDGALVFEPLHGEEADEPLQIVEGARLPGAEPRSRVVVYQALTVAGIGRMSGVLGEQFAPRGVSVEEDPAGNALLFAGPAAEVADALAYLRVLDQPLARARVSRRVVLAHADPVALAEDLEQILQSEGIDARRNTVGSAVVVLALSAAPDLLLFATRRDLMEHALAWVNLLDREAAGAGGVALFRYPLLHADAAVLADTLAALPPAPRKPAPVAQSTPNEEEVDGGERVGPVRRSAPREAVEGRFAADTLQNTLLFRGNTEAWRRWLPAIRSMDVARQSVRLEAVVAELSLDDSVSSGIDWLARESVGDYQLQALNQGNAGDGGFELRIDKEGELRALLRLFGGSSRVSLRAQPRLLVASGASARLEVGDEVPLRSSTSRSLANANAPLITNVEYRRTGLLLEVQPTVLAGGRLELVLRQSFSQARENASSTIDSPTILSRDIETTVTLSDGEALLLGGLVAQSDGEAGRGLPVASRLPLADALFGARQRSAQRTELLVLLVPTVASATSPVFTGLP